MNHNSDFESGAFLDLECSQTFKPTQTLANFLESTETELQAEQTSTPVKTAKVGIKRNVHQLQQNLELRCSKKQKQTSSSKNSKNSLAPPTTMEIAIPTEQTEITKGEQRRLTMLDLPMTKLLSWVKINIGKNLRDLEIFIELMTIIFNLPTDTEDPIFYPITMIVLMITVILPKQMPEILHPKKWMTFIPETVTIMNEMETTNFQPLTTQLSKLLTNLRLKIKTSVLSLSIPKNSLMSVLV